MSTVPTYLQPEIKIKRLHEKANLTRAYPDDAGADMVSTGDAIIPSGQAKKLNTGIAIEIPIGYVGIVSSRSGHSKYQIKLANSIGVIDSQYRGEIMVYLENTSDTDFTVHAGDRICQLLVVPIILPRFTEVDELSETNRGEGGFGSTGKS